MAPLPPEQSIENGNRLGTRPVVRQSALYRQNESGNTMKALLGHDDLAWETEQQEGVFKGRPVYQAASNRFSTPTRAESSRGASPSSRGGGSAVSSHANGRSRPQATPLSPMKGEGSETRRRLESLMPSLHQTLSKDDPKLLEKLRRAAEKKQAAEQDTPVGADGRRRSPGHGDCGSASPSSAASGEASSAGSSERGCSEAGRSEEGMGSGESMRYLRIVVPLDAKPGQELRVPTQVRAGHAVSQCLSPAHDAGARNIPYPPPAHDLRPHVVAWAAPSHSPPLCCRYLPHALSAHAELSALAHHT